jgi:hypothetical protein
MQQKIWLTLLVSGIGALCLAESHYGSWPVHDQQTIEKTLAISGNPVRLAVDNLSGHVHVTGTNSGSQVHVFAREFLNARTQADLNQAKSEVRLDIAEQSGSVSITYVAPWRCGKDCRGCCGGNYEHSYEVSYDIDVEAPRNASMEISTVNGGLRLEQIDGNFNVHSVNGGIQMSGIGGSGDVRTVNGGITVQFSRNPLNACNFKSVNGGLDAQFQPGLSADLLFKTLHGGVYSDFDVTSLPLPAGEAERRNGMFVYRSNRSGSGRAGRGGPQLSFETLNGGIRLHENRLEE